MFVKGFGDAFFNPLQKKRKEYAEIWELFLTNRGEFDEFITKMDNGRYADFKLIFKNYIIPTECQGNEGKGFRVNVNSSNEEQSVKSIIEKIKNGDFDYLL